MKILLFVLALLSSLSLSAQSAKFEVRVVNRTDDSRISGATVSVYEITRASNDQLYQQTTDSLGEVLFDLIGGKEYKIVIESTGMVPRFLLVDLKDYTEEFALVYSPRGQCVVGLLLKSEKVDYEYIINNPITRFYFKSGTEVLHYDPKMASKMADELEKITSSN